MITHNLKFNKEILSFDIEEDNLISCLIPNAIDYEFKSTEAVRNAILNPIGTARLKDIVSRGETVAIVTSDITRPMPSKTVLPFVIEELLEGGIKESDIFIVLALGSHRKHTAEEMKYLVGNDIYNSEIRVMDSDMEDCVCLGKCKNGTPVDIYTPVAEADRVICLGNVEFHYFAGYSGGAKALMPGVSSWEAIQANHSNMVKAGAEAGNLISNPVRQDIEETAEFIKIDFIVNVVLDDKKEIVGAVSGHYSKAHRVACKMLDRLYSVDIEKRADIVVVSAGGYPKDINIYQAQKALDNAKGAVRESGIIILVASCKEGFGEHTFEEWMTTMTPDKMIDTIKKDFKLGGHKAAAIAMILKKNKIFLVSDLDNAIVRSIGFEPFATVDNALYQAYKEIGEKAQLYIIPYGGSILPKLKI